MIHAWPPQNAIMTLLEVSSNVGELKWKRTILKPHSKNNCIFPEKTFLNTHHHHEYNLGLCRNLLEFADLLYYPLFHRMFHLLYPSHTEGKTGCWPLTTAKFLVVLGSLVTIADNRVMVLLTFGQVFAYLWLIPDLCTTILMILVMERYLVQCACTKDLPMIDWS